MNLTRREGALEFAIAVVLDVNNLGLRHASNASDGTLLGGGKSIVRCTFAVVEHDGLILEY